jgi:hypothetical protein
MTEPRRLIEETDNEVEALLLRAGQAYRPPPSIRAGALAALGVGGSSLVLAKSATAAVSVWSLKGWIVAGLIVGGSTAGLGLAVSQQETATTVEPTRMPVTPAEVRSEPPAVVPRPAAAPEAAAPPEPAAEPATPAAPLPKARPAKPTLTEELAAVDAASSALRAGDGAGAMRMLDEYARRFPRGRLRLEASVLRIEALAKTGQRAEAARRAKAFLKRYPNSVLAPRLKRYAGG